MHAAEEQFYVHIARVFCRGIASTFNRALSFSWPPSVPAPYWPKSFCSSFTFDTKLCQGPNCNAQQSLGLRARWKSTSLQSFFIAFILEDAKMVWVDLSSSDTGMMLYGGLGSTNYTHSAWASPFSNSWSSMGQRSQHSAANTCCTYLCSRQTAPSYPLSKICGIRRTEVYTSPPHSLLPLR